MNKSLGKKIKRILFILSILVLTVLLLDNSVKIFYPLKYRTVVAKYSEQYGLDPFLVFAVIRVESSFKPDAVSPKKAKGLMQISDKTGKWAAEKLDIVDYNADMLYEPEVNIAIGCWYLDLLSQQYGQYTETVLAAYNAGSGNVSQWLKDKELSRDGKQLDKIPFKETEKYLKRVKNSYSIYKKLYENSF